MMQYIVLSLLSFLFFLLHIVVAHYEFYLINQVSKEEEEKKDLRL